VKRSISLLLVIALVCSCLCGVSFAVQGYAISQDGIDFIKDQEGFIPYRVWDNSQWSIGYGTACSANAYDEDVLACLDAGMNAHVAKPFNFETLAHKLLEIIKN